MCLHQRTFPSSCPSRLMTHNAARADCGVEYTYLSIMLFVWRIIFVDGCNEKYEKHFNVVNEEKHQDARSIISVLRSKWTH